MPAWKEARKSLVVDRFDLLAKRGETCATQPAEHVGFAPFALGATRPELSPNEPAFALEAPELPLCSFGRQAKACSDFGGGEGTAAACVADEEAAERIVRDLEEGIRQTGGRHRADGVAVPAGVLGSDQARFAADADLHRPPLGL